MPTEKDIDINNNPDLLKMNIKKVWNDPVGSKVISSFVIFLISAVYSAIRSYVDNIGFVDISLNIFGLYVRLWIVVVVLILCLLLIGLFAKMTKFKQFHYDRHSYDCDKMLYDSFMNDLTPHGSIDFLRTNNFAGFSFHLSSLKELDDFYHKYTNDPRIEFFHPELERIRLKMMTDIDHFKDLICINTFPGVSDDLQTIPPEWEEENPKHFREVVNEIHNAANQVCADYDEFVKVGRKMIKL